MNIRNTKRRMSGTNTCKEHLQYNEQERKVKLITFGQLQNSMNPRHLRQNSTRITLEYPHSNYPCHPHYLAGPNSQKIGSQVKR